jgi:hypothetical protein
MYEQKLHKRHRGVVKAAQHVEGWLFTEPEKGETKASDVDVGSFNGKRMHLTEGGLEIF